MRRVRLNQPAGCRCRWTDEASAGSVAEVADSGEDHGEAETVGGGDHVVVLDGTSGLNDGCGSGGCHGLKTVGEREECVGSGDGALERKDSLLRTEACGVHPAHLAGADA